jgi:hypothetical protein
MTSVRHRLARRRLRPAILATNSDSSASMRSDTPESRFFLIHSHPNHVDTFHSFDIFNFDILDFVASSLENSATYDLASLARVLPLPHVYERNAGKRRRYVTGFHIPQVEQVVPRSAVSQGIRTVGFRALWPVAGPQLTGRCCHE